MRTAWLTTTDNPFDYWSQHDDWKRFDEDKGYYTSNLVARLITTSNDLTEEANLKDIEDAVDFIVAWNPTGNYKKIYHEENFNEDAT